VLDQESAWIRAVVDCLSMQLVATPVIYFLGNVHGNFDHVIEAVEHPSAMLG